MEADNVNEEQVVAIRDVLSWLPRKVLAEIPRSPQYMMNSLAEREARTVGPEAVDDVLALGGTCIAMMGDIMTSVATILMLEPVSLNSLSIGNLIRTQLESSAQASWLLDPSISPKVRVARRLVLELEGLRSAHAFVSQFEEYFPGDSKIAKPYGTASLIQRWDLGKMSAENLQLDLVPPDGDRFRRIESVGGVSLPGPTDLTRQEVGTKLPYSLLSKIDHINPVAMLSVENIFEMRRVVLAFLPKILQWYVPPVWWYFTLCRLDLNQLETILDEAWDAANLSAADKVWRQYPMYVAKGPVFA